MLKAVDPQALSAVRTRLLLGLYLAVLTVAVFLLRFAYSCAASAHLVPACQLPFVRLATIVVLTVVATLLSSLRLRTLLLIEAILSSVAIAIFAFIFSPLARSLGGEAGWGLIPLYYLGMAFGGIMLIVFIYGILVKLVFGLSPFWQRLIFGLPLALILLVGVSFLFLGVFSSSPLDCERFIRTQDFADRVALQSCVVRRLKIAGPSPDICVHFKNPDARFACEEFFQSDHQNCFLLEELWERDQCFLSLARTTGDPRACAAITPWSAEWQACVRSLV